MNTKPNPGHEETSGQKPETHPPLKVVPDLKDEGASETTADKVAPEEKIDPQVEKMVLAVIARNKKPRSRKAPNGQLVPAGPKPPSQAVRLSRMEKWCRELETKYHYGQMMSSWGISNNELARAARWLGNCAVALCVVLSTTFVLWLLLSDAVPRVLSKFFR